MPSLDEAPSAILGLGACRFYQSSQLAKVSARSEA